MEIKPAVGLSFWFSVCLSHKNSFSQLAQITNIAGQKDHKGWYMFSYLKELSRTLSDLHKAVEENNRLLREQTEYLHHLRVSLLGSNPKFPNFLPLVRLQESAESSYQLIKQDMKNCVMFGDRGGIYAYIQDKITDGLIIECGVATGGTINCLARIFPDRILHGFDSFEGLPEDWHGHTVPKGRYTRDGELPKVCDNVRLHKGWFEDSLPLFIEKNKEQIALLHIDCDLYSSTKTILECFNKQIVKDTVIIFDEFYNYRGWKDGEYKAWMEFVEKYDKKFAYLTATEQYQVAVKIVS